MSARHPTARERAHAAWLLWSQRERLAWARFKLVAFTAGSVFDARLDSWSFTSAMRDQAFKEYLNS